MERSNESKLKALIIEALTGNGQLPDREIARSVIRLDPALCAAWLEDRVCVLARTLRPKAPGAAQLAFPFHDLSITIPLKNGRVAELGPATIGVLRQSERVLLKKFRLDRRKSEKTFLEKRRLAEPRANSLLGKIQREIALMEPWAYSNRRITVERVQALIAEGTPPPPAPRRSLMSDAMRRYWDGKSPEERAAIVRRRLAKQRMKKAAK